MDVSARGVVEVARERFATRDYYGALLYLEDLTGSGRAYADVHHLRGLCFSLLDRPEDALVEFDRALSLNGRYLEALLHRGLVLNQLGGRGDEAAAAFAWLLPRPKGRPSPASAPRWPRASPTSTRGSVICTPEAPNALAEAVLEYRRAVELGPAFHDLRLRLARLLLEAGNPLQAREELEVILLARPEWVDARVQLGLARFLSGDAPSARATPGARALWIGLTSPGLRRTSRWSNGFRNEDRTLPSAACIDGVFHRASRAGAPGRRRKHEGSGPMPSRTIAPRVMRHVSSPSAPTRHCREASVDRLRQDLDTSRHPTPETGGRKAGAGLARTAYAAERAGNQNALALSLLGLRHVAPGWPLGRLALRFGRVGALPGADAAEIIPAALAAVSRRNGVDPLLAAMGHAERSAGACDRAVPVLESVIRRTSGSELRDTASIDLGSRHRSCGWA